MYMITKRQVHGKEYVKRLAIIYNGVQRTTFSYRLHFAAFSSLLRRCSVFCWRCFFEMTPGLFALWYGLDRKSTRLNSSHVKISYAVFCLKKKNRTVTYLHEHI